MNLSKNYTKNFMIKMFAYKEKYYRLIIHYLLKINHHKIYHHLILINDIINVSPL